MFLKQFQDERLLTIAFIIYIQSLCVSEFCIHNHIVKFIGPFKFNLSFYHEVIQNQYLIYFILIYLTMSSTQNM